MADKIKMAAKHEFSIANLIFMETNWNLRFGKFFIKKGVDEFFFLNYKMAD
jgi:hypothetical protein